MATIAPYRAPPEQPWWAEQLTGMPLLGKNRRNRLILTSIGAEFCEIASSDFMMMKPLESTWVLSESVNICYFFKTVAWSARCPGWCRICYFQIPGASHWCTADADALKPLQVDTYDMSIWSIWSCMLCKMIRSPLGLRISFNPREIQRQLWHRVAQPQQHFNRRSANLSDLLYFYYFLFISFYFYLFVAWQSQSFFQATWFHGFKDIGIFLTASRSLEQRWLERDPEHHRRRSKEHIQNSAANRLIFWATCALRSACSS